MPSANPAFTSTPTAYSMKVGVIAFYGNPSLKPIRLSDRGGHANYGSGPYFRAQKIPTVSVSGVEYPFGEPQTLDRNVNGVGWQGNALWRNADNSYYYVWANARGLADATYTEYRTVLKSNGGSQKFWYLQTWYSHVRLSGQVGWHKPFTIAQAVAIASLLPEATLTSEVLVAWEDWSRILRKDAVSTAILSDASFNFKNDEYNTFLTKTDIGVWTNGVASRFAAAYTAATDGIGDSEINSIANVFQTIDAIKSTIESIRDPSKIKDTLNDYKDIRNVWLAYRYSYTTTKSDIKEYFDLIPRLVQLQHMCNNDIHAVGDYEDDTGSYRCELRIPVKQVLPYDMSSWLSKLGFEPNLQNIWDMIPYSFVVDWFLHLGDIMSAFDNWTYSLSLEPTEIWYTYVSSYDGQYCFYRIKSGKINVPPHYAEKQTSGKTWLMRLADAISLFS